MVERDDLYEVLQLSPNADPEVVEAAYRRLARKYHPDRNPDRHPDADAETRMQAINRAFAVLGDADRRAIYDYQRRLGLVPTADTTPHPGAGAQTGPLVPTRPPGSPPAPEGSPPAPEGVPPAPDGVPPAPEGASPSPPVPPGPPAHHPPHSPTSSPTHSPAPSSSLVAPARGQPDGLGPSLVRGGGRGRWDGDDRGAAGGDGRVGRLESVRVAPDAPTGPLVAPTGPLRVPVGPTGTPSGSESRGRPARDGHPPTARAADDAARDGVASRRARGGHAAAEAAETAGAFASDAATTLPAPGAAAAGLAHLDVMAFAAAVEALAEESGLQPTRWLMVADDAAVLVARRAAAPHERALVGVVRRALTADDPLLLDIERLRRDEERGRTLLHPLVAAALPIRQQFARYGITVTVPATLDRLLERAVAQGHFAWPADPPLPPPAPAPPPAARWVVVVDAIPERQREPTWRALRGAGLRGGASTIPARLPWGIEGEDRGRADALCRSLRGLGCGARVVLADRLLDDPASGDGRALATTGTLARDHDPDASPKRCACHRCGARWRVAAGWPPRHCPACGTPGWARHEIVQCWCCGHETALPVAPHPAGLGPGAGAAPRSSVPAACARCGAVAPATRDPLRSSPRAQLDSGDRSALPWPFGRPRG